MDPFGIRRNRALRRNLAVQFFQGKANLESPRPPYSTNAYLLSAKWGHSQKNVGFKPFGSTLFFLLGISNKYPIGLTYGVVGGLKALADST